jgi:uncharacterized protein YbbC (DUF1343 family)
MTGIRMWWFLFWLILSSCSGYSEKSLPPSPERGMGGSGVGDVIVGAARMEVYLPLLEGKTIALVVNQTSMIGDTHLADTLHGLGITIQAIFSPEHGFRGKADAGEKIEDGRDPRTGIPLISLYGSKREPTAEDLAGVDLMVFDIQDVGARFYTYISTMHYVMQACAKNGTAFMVLDRPNPNGHYVDGPIRQPGYESFVGMHPVPVVHGMTVGEYAKMINGEGWLEGGRQCELKVIPCENYDHRTFYNLPVKPSPNLPNMHSIYFYPWLCFFEGTVASVGRGTTKQFQVIGHPDFPEGDYTFTPVPRPGAMHPKLEGRRCRGYDLSTIPLDTLRRRARLDLSYLIDFYRAFPDKDDFFLENLWIDKLAGGPTLRAKIVAGASQTEIRESWQEELQQFMKVRGRYLLYEDFE